MDQETGEDLNPTRSRQNPGGEISEMARNPDRYCAILPIKPLQVRTNVWEKSKYLFKP